MDTPKTRSALKEIEQDRFVIIAADPECYETRFCRGAELLTTLASLVYTSATAMPDDEMAKLRQFADEKDNWFEAESGPAHLTWDIGSESGAKIDVYRLTVSRTETETGKKLVALARAAWSLADGTEGTVDKDENSEPYLRVPEDLHKALCDGLDALDTLPELPAPYIGEGPAKAEHALGLSELP